MDPRVLARYRRYGERGAAPHEIDRTGEDLAAAIAFFVELGMELEGETTVEGEFADQLIGLNPRLTNLTTKTYL